MPEFVLETSGIVHMNQPLPMSYALQWCDLDTFTQGYIECLFFTSECPQVETREFRTKAFRRRLDNGQADGVLPCDVGFGDLASEALADIIADCKAFQEANAGLLGQAYERDYDAAQAGRDFWFTRNGHGVGYWDRTALEPDDPEYERLTDIMVAASASGDNAAWDKACRERNALKAESIGQKLSAACGHGTPFGTVDPNFGDDGKVYLS